LTGVLPIGAFVLVHLFTNAYSWSPQAFNDHVKSLNETPLVKWIEYLGIMAPIAFHGLLGLWMAIRMDLNQGQYSNYRNWMYLFQRISGVIVLGFIIFHLIQFRFGEESAFKDVSLEHYDPHKVIREGLLRYPFIAPLYMIGILATSFHFANGLWSFCVTWGITVGRRSQLIMSYLTMAVFLGVASLGVYAFCGFLWSRPLGS